VILKQEQVKKIGDRTIEG